MSDTEVRIGGEGLLPRTREDERFAQLVELDRRSIPTGLRA